MERRHIRNSVFLTLGYLKREESSMNIRIASGSTTRKIIIKKLLFRERKHSPVYNLADIPNYTRLETIIQRRCCFFTLDDGEASFALESLWAIKVVHWQFSNHPLNPIR